MNVCRVAHGSVRGPGAAVHHLRPPQAARGPVSADRPSHQAGPAGRVQEDAHDQAQRGHSRSRTQSGQQGEQCSSFVYRSFVRSFDRSVECVHVYALSL